MRIGELAITRTMVLKIDNSENLEKMNKKLFCSQDGMGKFLELKDL